MNLKIDTKEKFHEINLLEENLTVNMADELRESVTPLFADPVRNVILLLSSLQSIDSDAAEVLALVQQSFYDAGASFVICEAKPQVEKVLDEAGLLEVMNLTPTLSEAWDIVQMEEIEREFFDNE